MSSFLENTQDANRDATSRLITNSQSDQSDALELVALQTLVRDNLSDGQGGNLPTVSTGAGTTTDVDYDFKTQNLINHDLYSSQVHIIHSSYIAGSAQAQFVDSKSGVQDLSQIELTSATSTYVAGKLKLNITNGPDDISLNSVDGTTKHEIKFTSDLSGTKSFTKALLTSSEQDNNNTTLINVKEDTGNLSLLDTNPTGIVDENGNALYGITASGNTGGVLNGVGDYFDVSMINNNGQTIHTLSNGATPTFTNNEAGTSKPWDVVPGVYRIQSFAEAGLTVDIVSAAINDVSSLSITDICGRHVLDSAGYSAQVDRLAPFLPTLATGVTQTSYKENPSVNGYNFKIDLSAAGSYTGDFNNSAGQPRFEFVNTQDTCGNIAYMTALRNYGTNKDASLNNGATVVPDVSSHSVSITNSTVDLSFNNVNAVSFTNGAGKFKVDLSSSMDEFLPSILQGEIKLYKRNDGERLDYMNKNDVSNIIQSTKVAYPGETALAQGTETATTLLSEGDAKNIAAAEDVKYTVVSRFPNPGSTLLNNVTLSGGNQSYAFVCKDVSSILFNDLSINVDLCSTTIATLQNASSNGVTLIRLEDNNIFAVRENKLIDLDTKGGSNLTHTNPDIQIYVDGTNVDLSLAGVYNYDQVRMFIEAKKLSDDLSGQTGSSYEGFNATSDMNSGSGLSFSLDSGDTYVKTKINNDSRLNELVWDIIDADAANSGAKLDVSFDVVPNYSGDVSAHEFESKIQTQIHIQWANVNGTVQNEYLYPEDYSMTTLDISQVETALLTYPTSGAKKVSEHISTKKVSISDPFKFGAYANLNIDISGLEIKDTFYEYYYENGTKAPQGRLRNLPAHQQYAAKREITFTNSNGTTGAESRKLGLNAVKTFKLQLQGRDKDNQTFSTNEPKHGLDVAFNQRTTINSFNNNTAASFNIDIDLDSVNNVELGASQYEIILDFGEGNGIWNLSKKSGSMADVMNGISFGPNTTMRDGLQSIFSAPNFVPDNQLASLHTVHTVTDSTGVNTLEVKNGTDILATLTGEKTLLANFVLAIGHGPVFEVTRTTGTNNEDLSFNEMKYTDTSTLMIDNGIQLTIDENLVQFNNVEASFNLLPDKMAVAHTGQVMGGSEVVIGTQTGGLLEFTDPSAQTVLPNAYRGIIANQTIEINRTLGSYKMAFDGNDTTTQDLLAGNELDVSFATYGDLGFELKSNMSHVGIINGVAKNTFAVTVKPALYKVSGTSSIDENYQITAYSIVSDHVLDFSFNSQNIPIQIIGSNGSPATAYHLYLNQSNPGRLKSSFSEVLFDFFQQSSDANPKEEGIFVADRIATRIDSGSGDEVTNNDLYGVDQATGQTYEIKKQNDNDNGFGNVIMTGTRTGVNQYAKFNDTTTNDATIPFSVFLKSELLSVDINHVFEIKAPKFEVEYRNAQNVDRLPVTRNDNVNTETFTINDTVVEADGTTITSGQTVATFKLNDISLNVNLDVNKNYVDYLYNHDDKVYSTDMSGSSNLVTATVEYSPSLNPTLVNETLVNNLSINSLTKDTSGKFYLLNMGQDVSGLYDTFPQDRYDVCGNLVKSGNNIFVKLPSAYINPTTNDASYNFDMTPYNGVKTSLIGAEYDISGTVPIIKIRKYTSPMSTPFENLGIDANNVRAVRFQADKIEEAKVELASVVFGSTPYNFQTVLNDTANALTTLPTYNVISKVTLSNETIWDNYASSHLEYVLVPLSFSGVGNILEVTQANATYPVKTLIVNTPDVTRIVSADGAPVFRLRANGRIDTGSVTTSLLTTLPSRLSSSDKSPVAEFINYNVLLG